MFALFTSCGTCLYLIRWTFFHVGCNLYKVRNLFKRSSFAKYRRYSILSGLSHRQLYQCKQSFFRFLVRFLLLAVNTWTVCFMQYAMHALKLFIKYLIFLLRCLHKLTWIYVENVVFVDISHEKKGANTDSNYQSFSFFLKNGGKNVALNCIHRFFLQKIQCQYNDWSTEG